MLIIGPSCRTQSVRSSMRRARVAGSLRSLPGAGAPLGPAACWFARGEWVGMGGHGVLEGSRVKD